MKILYVTNMYPNMSPSLPYAGIFVKEQIDAIKKRSPSFVVDMFIINGIESKLNYITSIFQIWKKIKEFKPDVIHVHYGLSGLFLLFFPWLKAKTVVTLHGGDIMPQQKKWVQNYISKRVIKNIGHVIILNEQMMEIVSKITTSWSEIKCGVDLDFFNCNEVPTIEECKQIVFPANPERKVKNFPLFEETMEYIKKNSSLKLEFVTLDEMSREEVKSTLCTSHCMLFTSLSEGSPQVIKEAMACNLPVVSVNVGDVKSILEATENCFVSKGYDAKELGDLCITILLKSERSNGLSILENLNLDNDRIATKLIQIYNQVIAK